MLASIRALLNAYVRLFPSMMLSLLAAVTPWTLLLGGDVMLNQVKPSAEVFKGIEKLVRTADLAYANLEIPFTRAKRATPRKTASELRAKTQFILKADPGHAPYFAGAGFDAVSLGNNHAMDYRAEGLAEFVDLLDKHKIGWFGAGKNWAEARRLRVFTVGGVRVGFLSFLSFNNPGSMQKCTPATATNSGIAALTITGSPDEEATPRIRAIVDAAKKGCDLLAVCLHWGIERQPLPAPNQVRLGRMFIDQGADLVIGAHPHVLQPGELYKGKPIVYSLGNLVAPRPGSTALYQLRYEGTTLKGIDYYPAQISGGRVSLVGKTPSTPAAAVRAEEALRRRYPSKESKPFIAGQQVASRSR